MRYVKQSKLKLNPLENKSNTLITYISVYHKDTECVCCMYRKVQGQCDVKLYLANIYKAGINQAGIWQQCVVSGWKQKESKAYSKIKREGQPT